jgi:hypothetical protein
MEKQWKVPPAMSYQKYHYGDDITDPNNVPYKDDPKKMKDFFGDKVKPNPKKNRKDIGIQNFKFDNANESIDQDLSGISKTIMERGMGPHARELARKRMQGDKPSTPSPEVEIKEPEKPDMGSKPQSSPSPSPEVKGSEPSRPAPVKKPMKPIDVASSYDPLANKGILGISEKILKKNFNLGEEGYDIARDEGRVKPSKDKKDGTTMPPSKEMEKTRKVNKGPSAFEIVKKKYGKAVMDVDKKKKDKK